jgi:hypothetical protein
MKINVVYVLVYEGTKKYLNQLGVSVLSLKQVHPDVHVTVVSDPGSRQRVARDSAKLLESIDEWIVEDCPDMPPVARSYYLKTRMPDLVRSDFVFLDADTIAIRPFYEEISAVDGDVAMVQDRSHVHPIQPRFPEFIVPKLEAMNWPTYMSKYYNTGVGFYRATKARDDLVANWQRLWWDRWKKVECEGDDQICFNVATQQSVARVHELSPVFNAMVNVHPIHAVNARIYHFFAGNQSHFGSSLLGHLVEHYERFQELDLRELNRAKEMEYPWMPPYWPKHLWKAGMRTKAIKYFFLYRLGLGQ